MKKIILVAGIFAAGVVSANTTDLNKEKETAVVVTASTTENAEEEKPAGLTNDTERRADCITIYHTTSCGVPASTCQSGWSVDRMFEWAYALEANYCG